MAHVDEFGNELDECLDSPDYQKRHLWHIDQDDRRFKMCVWCDISRYRSDKELLEEARDVKRRHKAK